MAASTDRAKKVEEVVSKWKSAFRAANNNAEPPEVFESSVGWYYFGNNIYSKYRLKDIARFTRRLEAIVTERK